MPVPQNGKEFKRYRTEVGRTVASELGNSPTIALNSYVAPEVFCALEANSPLLKKKTWGKQSSQTNELLECIHYDQEVDMEESVDSQSTSQLE